MLVNMKNPQSNGFRQCKLGFSWTTFFFGAFVPLFRKDWMWFLIMLVLDFCTFGISNIVFCFIYNRLYVKRLLAQGYLPEDKSSVNILKSKNIQFMGQAEKDKPRESTVNIAVGATVSKKQKSNSNKRNNTQSDGVSHYHLG